jgi:hypothetical protein
MRIVASAFCRDATGPALGERRLEAWSPQAAAARRNERSTGA